MCISKPDFAFSYFMSIFWGFCLTFKLAVKCNARNHLESYHRLNSLINVICHDGMPLDYYFFFLIADCASIFLTSSFLKLVKPNSCLWMIVFDYNHLYQSYARVNSDLLLSLIKKKIQQFTLIFLQSKQCPCEDNLLSPGIFTLKSVKIALQKSKCWFESMGRACMHSYKYKMRLTLNKN